MSRDRADEPSAAAVKHSVRSFSTVGSLNSLLSKRARPSRAIAVDTETVSAVTRAAAAPVVALSAAVSICCRAGPKHHRGDARQASVALPRALREPVYTLGHMEPVDLRGVCGEIRGSKIHRSLS